MRLHIRSGFEKRLLALKAGSAVAHGPTLESRSMKLEPNS
jgi:hypothetical protein